MYLAADCPPEFDSFKERLLELAQIRSIAELLRRVVTSLAEPPYVALARIWLVDKGDLCSSCTMRAKCPDQTSCLHLVASAGRPQAEVKADWSRLDDEFQRIPLGVGKIGRVAATGRALVVKDVTRDPALLSRRDWATAEDIHGFDAQPIRYKDDVLGVLALFVRIPIPDQGPAWLRIFADHIAVAFVNARAFEENDRLRARLELETIYLREEIREAKALGEIIGESASLKQMQRQIGMVAPTDATVLILGESGVGKELVAREIHQRSRRSQQPLIRVNCASVPRELYESEFFGHAKGSFTGAIKDRAGRFEAADGGTLFLDEVGEIPVELQSKLLRVLQERQYERVGEERTRSINVRILAASSRDLRAEVEAGRFRRDLYYRLNVFPIEVAPLRDHKEDIPLLAEHFLGQAAQRLKVPLPKLTDAHLVQLRNYGWPGNVREMQNLIERALILAQRGPLRFDLPPAQGEAPMPEPRQGAGAAVSEVQILTEPEFRLRERANILAALSKCGWRIHGPGGAAELLRINPSTLVSRIRTLGLKKPG
ncbi:Transcriptional regulator, NifA subfamily, Fis Family [Verrucomicrobia bacterium]|nr:Transcriptional regulator, NifA subfamily, Fis Family [Verrucomicrobiota bacterium]